MKRLLGWSNWKSSGKNIVSLAALAALCFGLLASSLLANNLANENTRQHRNVTSQELSSVSSQISEKVSGYEQMLFSGAALMRLNPGTTRDQWKEFISNLRIDERYPSTLGFGYVSYFSASQLPDYEANLRQEGFDDIKVTPIGPRDYYTSITYLEPLDDTNRRAVGYDMLSEPTRRLAMLQAADTAGIAISTPVDLVQYSNVSNAPKGVLLYYPVYDTVLIPNTIEARREHLSGFTYIILVPEKILSASVKNHPSLSGRLQIKDKTGNSEIYLAGERSFEKENKVVSQIVTIADRTWQFSLLQSRDTFWQHWVSLAIFGLGAIISMFCAALIFNMLNKRLEKLSNEYNQKIQQTKENMLALASHQLRTPASGVKQYVGMLLQGFVGDLTPDQKSVAKKAFVANERQLEIINQMLYVAKADAGQLMLEPTRINLHILAKNAVNIQKQIASNKKIRLVLKGAKSVWANGDPQYVSMIIENLISNAIKYSYPKSEIVVRAFQSENKACLSVSDYGVGIAAEDLLTVFEKFARVQNPLTHTEGGNGLGLYLAHGLAVAHGGSLMVESIVNQGSTFTLTIPKQRADKSPILVQLDAMETDININQTGRGKL